jgi:nitrogenase subunit NifH
MCIQKCLWKTIIELNPNQLQFTTYHAQANSIIEQVQKVVNNMLRLFDLEDSNENLEDQEDYPYYS